MPKELVISAAPHETRVAILEDGLLCEIYIEREKEFALVGSIYKGRVTRVLPGMQSAFVDIGLDSDAFLYVGDFLENLEDYDHVVAPVEGKIEKMEQQGGAVFAPPAAPATPGAPAEEPPASEVSPGNEAQPSAPVSESGVSPQPPRQLHAPAAAVSATGPRPRRTWRRLRPTRSGGGAAPSRWWRALAAWWRWWRRRPPRTRPSAIQVRFAAAVHAAALSACRRARASRRLHAGHSPGRVARKI